MTTSLSKLRENRMLNQLMKEKRIERYRLKKWIYDVPRGLSWVQRKQARSVISDEHYKQ
jgi:hypothetical protein